MKKNVFLVTGLMASLSLFTYCSSDDDSSNNQNDVDVMLTSQKEVNEFAIKCVDQGNCETIKGSLYISGNDISHLTPLKTITSITNELKIENTNNLFRTNGLENLKTVGGPLVLRNNEILVDIDDFQSITELERLTIRDNKLLKNLTGFQNLETVEGLHIISNENLENLYGLENVSKVKNIRIVNNSNLRSIDGLKKVEQLEGDLIISVNPLLKICDVLCPILSLPDNVKGAIEIIDNGRGCSNEENIMKSCDCPKGDQQFTSQEEIDAFSTNYPNCTKIYGSLVVVNTDATNFSPLSKITYVAGSVRIATNSNLTNLDGLEALATVKKNIVIQGNTTLDNCGNICTLIDGFPLDRLTVNQNEAGGNCETKTTLTDYCKL